MHMHVLWRRRCVYGRVLQVKRLLRAGGLHDGETMFIHEPCVVCMFVCCCLRRRGAWMFAEMLIHFRFGKFLHYPYVLLLGEVMPHFSGDHACVCLCVCMLRF